MKPNNKFKNLDIAFWANVRAISETIGYTKRNNGTVLEYNITDIEKAVEKIKLKKSLYFNKTKPTELTTKILKYSNYRANILNTQVRTNLLNKDIAKKLFTTLKKKYNPNCPIPMNKQKGTKKTPAFFTAMINILIENAIKDHNVDYEPKELIKVFKNKILIHTLSRRVDGAYPSTRSPIAIWEIKEYYNTTTFGSRVADGIYETLLDGFELEVVLNSKKIKVFHYLFVDDYFTWWVKGKSYLCRIIDMLHMGKIDEAIFGKEILEAIPRITHKWIHYKK
ncbi:MAG: hypothetical protein OXM55_02360 [Bdellovibrionales bacterium]|nr:hypothetical protein [Bdellovibrionales bacterium]